MWFIKFSLYFGIQLYVKDSARYKGSKLKDAVALFCRVFPVKMISCESVVYTVTRHGNISGYSQACRAKFIIFSQKYLAHSFITEC